MRISSLMVSGVFALAALSPSAQAEPSSAMANARQAKMLIEEFTLALQGELQGAMKAGGPIAAVAICKTKAPGIAETLSEKSGWQVGRTSLKPRNVAQNSPDPWERRVMQQFEYRARPGENLNELTYAEVVSTEEGRSYRFMKAIPTAEVCLACHGQAISPKVAAALDEAYPQDQARGYQAGDLRGAFSLEKPL